MLIQRYQIYCVIYTKTAELLGRGEGTAIFRYKQSSLIKVFGFHISAPENPGYIVSGTWTHALGLSCAFNVFLQL